MACQGVKGLLKAFCAYYGFGIGGKFVIDVFDFFFRVFGSDHAQRKGVNSMKG